MLNLSYVTGTKETHKCIGELWFVGFIYPKWRDLRKSARVSNENVGREISAANVSRCLVICVLFLQRDEKIFTHFPSKRIICASRRLISSSCPYVEARLNINRPHSRDPCIILCFHFLPRILIERSLLLRRCPQINPFMTNVAVDFTKIFYKFFNYTEWINRVFLCKFEKRDVRDTSFFLLIQTFKAVWSEWSNLSMIEEKLNDKRTEQLYTRDNYISV